MKLDDLNQTLKDLADTLASVEINNCTEIGAGQIHDALHAVASAIDDLTEELKQHRHP